MEIRAHLKHGMTRCVEVSISALVGARTYHLTLLLSNIVAAQSIVGVHHLGVVGDDWREARSATQEGLKRQECNLLFGVQSLPMKMPCTRWVGNIC